MKRKFRFVFDDIFARAEGLSQIVYGSPQDTLLACVLELQRKYRPLYGPGYKDCGNIDFESQSEGNSQWFPMTGMHVLDQWTEEVQEAIIREDISN